MHLLVYISLKHCIIFTLLEHFKTLGMLICKVKEERILDFLSDTTLGNHVTPKSIGLSASAA